MITQTDQRENLKKEIVENPHKDLLLVTCNGVFSSSKFILLNIVPQISDYIPGFIITYDIVTIILPDISINCVREAFEKLLDTGDPSHLERVLGLIEVDNQIYVKSKNGDESSKIEGQNNVDEYKPCKMLEEVLIKEEKDEEKEENRGEGKVEGEEYNNLFGEETFPNLDVEDHQKNKILNKKTRRERNKTAKKCDECERMFRCGYNLRRHKDRFHTKVLTCDRCDETFLGYDAYRLHRAGCVYTCEKCGKQTERMVLMEAHKRAHRREEIKNIPYVEKVTIVYQ